MTATPPSRYSRRDEPANASESLFRISILFVAGFGIAMIWVLRCVAWMRGKADSQH